VSGHLEPDVALKGFGVAREIGGACSMHDTAALDDDGVLR
jgi:hypothetical protein